MNSFDYSKLNEISPQQQHHEQQRQQQDVNMIHVVVQQPNQQYNAQQQYPKPTWSWCTLILSMFSLCCCQLLGFIAIVMSILSYVDHKSKDFVRSQNKRRHGRHLAIAAIVIGVIFIIAYGVIIFFFVFNGVEIIQGIEPADDAIPNHVQDNSDGLPDHFGSDVNHINHNIQNSANDLSNGDYYDDYYGDNYNDINNKFQSEMDIPPSF